jgi:hypothetical protein
MSDMGSARVADRRWYLLSALLVGSGLVHVVVQLVVGGPWAGPVSWRKPTTFGLSFGLTLATITWVTTFVPISARARTRLLTGFGFACLLEVTVITVQAWRKVPSHFNTSTPLNAAFAYTAAAGGAIIIVTSVAFAVASLRTDQRISPSMRLAVRVGFGSFLSALGIGAAMIVIGTVAARTESQDAAYTAATALKTGHAATMHGILVLPMLAWLASFTSWPESLRVQVISLGAVGYLLAAGVIVAETLTTIDPLRPWSGPVLPTVLGLAGLCCLLIAGGSVLNGCRTAVPDIVATVRRSSARLVAQPEK